MDKLADHPNQVDKSPYAYTWNNPVALPDPDGNCPLCLWLDATVDVAFILYDVSKLAYDKVKTGETKSEDWIALGADAASILVPMSVGAGMVVRATAKLEKITSGPLKVFSAGKRIDRVGGFASKEKLYDHFGRHAAEFGGKFRSAEQYLKGAQNFFKREGEEIIQYTRKNGEIVKYDTKNNIFGIVAEDGTIRTMFKPKEGFKYFKEEIKKDLGEETLKEFNKIF